MGAGYFAVLNEPMLAGREFAELDQQIRSNEFGFNRLKRESADDRDFARGTERDVRPADFSQTAM